MALQPDGAKVQFVTDTIAINTAVSLGINIPGSVVMGFSTPATWTACDLSFDFSDDGGATWKPVFDRSGKVTFFTTAASSIYTTPPIRANWVRANCSTNQTAATTINIRYGWS